MSTHELPDNFWHAHVNVHCGWLSCEKCGSEPDVLWAWDGIKGGVDATPFAVRVVPYLKELGWSNDGIGIICPACSAAIEKVAR